MRKCGECLPSDPLYGVCCLNRIPGSPDYCGVCPCCGAPVDHAWPSRRVKCGHASTTFICGSLYIVNHARMSVVSQVLISSGCILMSTNDEDTI